MKAKLLLAGFFMFVLSASYAQKNIPKGSLLLGGDLSFSSNTYKDNSSNNKASGFSISPSVGVALKDNLFGGIGLSYGYAKNALYYASPYYDSINVHSYGANLYVRKYKPLKNNFYIFLQGGLGVSASNRALNNNSTRDYSQKDLSVNLGISPGLSYAINSKLQIETGFNNIFGIGYSESKYRDNAYFTGERKSTGFNAYTTLNNFNSQLYFGFRLLLQKKDKGTAKAG